MKKTIAGGLTAVLLTGGVGFTSATAQASSSPTTAARARALVLPLDLCTVLGPLCGVSVLGPLLVGVQDALDDLLGAAPGGIPLSADELADAIRDALAAAPSQDSAQVTDAIAALLANAGLPDSVLDQVTGGLGGTAGGPVANVLQTVEDLLNGLLGIGGQPVDPTALRGLIQSILSEQADGDLPGLRGVLETLLQSLPGGSSLDTSALTGLVDTLATTVANAAAGTPVAPIINLVTVTLNPGAVTPTPAAAPSATPTLSAIKTYVTTTRPTIQGGGAPGASVTVRTSRGDVLGSTTVSSSGAFSLVSKKLKRGAYTVSATQVSPGLGSSASSAAQSFRVVSGSPVITTKANKRFGTHRPKISGIGYPKAKIVLRTSSGTKLGTARVRSNGTWSIKAKRLSSGTKKLKAVQTGYDKKRTSKTKKVRIR